MAGLQLLWLGAPIVQVDGQTIHFETRKATALLAYVSVARHPQPRDSLAALFWPEYDQKHAQASLRRNLFSIRKSLPETALISDGESIVFDQGSAWVDVDAFRQQLLAPRRHGHGEKDICDACLASLKQAINLYRGDFLAGLNLPDCSEFDEWQFLQREDFRQASAEGLEILVRGSSERCLWEEAIPYARRWVALDRLDEAAQRSLIDLYFQTSQPNKAHHQYNDYARVLKEQLGQEPDPEMVNPLRFFTGPTLKSNEPDKGTHPATRAGFDESPPTPDAPLERLPGKLPAAIPLLKTKLFVPSMRQKHIRRGRLVDTMGEAHRVNLTLISAPAGFGKTTLLSEWAATTPLPVAWISLDREDNDPVRFVYYLAAALENAQSDIPFDLPELYQSLQVLPILSVLEILIDRISAFKEPAFLVLDDYQFIHAQPVHDAVHFLLDHLPAQLHVIIATRADPPLMLPRLRVRSQLSEIRAAELRFTAAESTELLNQALDFHLSPVQIDTLQARTEGWIAGLQMAALAMQGQKDRASFIQTFSGSNRYIMDYLMEEVLRQSDPDIQQFLLNTSILDHFNAALCDAILQRHGSQLVLERLEGENLFLIPLDSERGWYRYHHLFGELLNNRLKQIQPDLIPALHDRASHWYESHGNIPEAIRQAQAAGDSQRVHDLVETNTLAILDYGELAGLVEWLGMLDQKAHYSRPHLSLAHAWALLYAGQLDEIEGVLENAEAAIQPGQNTDDVLDIQGQMAAIRAYLYSLKGDLNRKEQYAVEALERLPMQNSAVRAFAAGQLSHVYRFRGKLEESASILQKVIAQNVEGQDSHIWIDVACDLAGLRMAQGRRHEAAAIFQEIISRSKKVTEQGSRPNPEVASAYINYGWVLREWNDLPAAQQCTEEAVRLAEQWGQKDLLQVCYFEQARLLQALGEPDAARRVIQKAKELTSTLSPFARRAAEREEALLCLRQGNLQAASQWRKASGLTAQDEIGIHKLYPYRVFARVLLAEGEFAEGIPLLERLLAIEEEIGEGEQVINLLSLLALVLYQLGRVDQAIPLLEKSLALAEPEGFVRTFVDEGPPMADLLRVACENDRIKDTRLSKYAAHLLSAFSTAV